MLASQQIFGFIVAAFWNKTATSVFWGNYFAFKGCIFPCSFRCAHPDLQRSHKVSSQVAQRLRSTHGRSRRSKEGRKGPKEASKQASKEGRKEGRKESMKSGSMPKYALVSFGRRLTRSPRYVGVSTVEFPLLGPRLSLIFCVFVVSVCMFR